MRGLTGDELLRRPVQLRGIQLGRPVDVLLHPQEPQALGLDVLCGDERHRFLPVSAAEVREDHVEAASPLVLLDLRDDSYYRREARSLGSMRGSYPKSSYTRSIHSLWRTSSLYRFTATPEF